MEGIPDFAPLDGEVDGHRLTLYVRGRDRLSVLIETIERAQKSLRLVFYIFKEDKAGRRVLEALADARNRGVKVWLLVDGFGTARPSPETVALIEEAGIVYSRFNPSFGRGYLLRNHQKLVVADDTVALIGGTNIGDDYFADDPDGNSWHDLFLRVEGPAVRRLSGYFDWLRRWLLSSRPRMRAFVYILFRRSDARGLLRWLYNGPFRRFSPLTRAIREDIEAASKISMVYAYFAPNWGMLRRLGRVAQAGGDVRIVTAARSDNRITVQASRHCFRRLLKRGVRMFEYQAQMLHVKLAVIDNVTYLGSANFDLRSLYVNGEVMLRIEDPAFAAQMHDFCAAHESWSDAYSIERHRSRSSWLSRLRWLFAYFLMAGVDFSVARRVTLRRI